MKEKYLYKEETYRIIGACMYVHNALGNGFLEIVYHKSLEREFRKRGIPYRSMVKFKVFYEGIDLDKAYIADFVCFNKIILEIKATSPGHVNHFKQLLNYLKVSGINLGLLINFGQNSLQVKRVINTN